MTSLREIAVLDEALGTGGVDLGVIRGDRAQSADRAAFALRTDRGVRGAGRRTAGRAGSGWRVMIR